MSSVSRFGSIAVVFALAGLKACTTESVSASSSTRTATVSSSAAVVQPFRAASAGSVVEPLRAADTLRVCSDPNNMPFSNEKQQGFENAIASLVAGDLHRKVEYFWAPERRGFVRNTLKPGHCDVMMGVPAHYDLARPTRPYYRSTYVFVSRRERRLDVRSFDDPRLRRFQIGIQIVGNDYANPPAAEALAMRHITANVHGYTVYGDYSRPDPQRGVVDAVARGDVDVAIVWGPLAGYFAAREPIAIALRPVAPGRDDAALPFAFDISMAGRRDDAALHDALDAVIARRGAEIRRILLAFHVPLVERSET